MIVVDCGPGSIEEAKRADEHIRPDQLESCLDVTKNPIGKNYLTIDRPTAVQKFQIA